MQVIKLNEQEKAETGYNWKAVITHADLTETTADTDMTIALISTAIGAIVKDAAFYLKTAFEDASDAALNDTKVSVGDGGSSARFLAAIQVNENGTEVDASGSANTTPYVYTAADTIDLTVESMAAKSLSNIDTGELWVYINSVELSEH